MIKHDHVAQLGRSLIQHGPLSDRVYLMRLDPDDCPAIVDQIRDLAKTQGYSKIFAKVPESLVPLFHEAGYATEALLPGHFPAPGNHGREPGHFLGLYLKPWRAEEPDRVLLDQVLRMAEAKAHAPRAAEADPEVRRLGAADAEEMAALYDRVFATYPVPIHDPEYIRRAMASHAAYFGLRMDGRLAALGGCDMDPGLGQVELTDLATAPHARGLGLGTRILAHMESVMTETGLEAAYAIVRGTSPAANVCFARLGYAHAGTLIQNTNISGSLESMHVWHKTLGHTPTQS